MEEFEFYLIYFPLSLAMIFIGFGIRRYLKKYKLTTNFSASVYWLKLNSYALTFFGFLALIAVLMAAYFQFL